MLIFMCCAITYIGLQIDCTTLLKFRLSYLQHWHTGQYQQQPAMVAVTVERTLSSDPHCRCGSDAEKDATAMLKTVDGTEDKGGLN